MDDTEYWEEQQLDDYSTPLIKEPQMKPFERPVNSKYGAPMGRYSCKAYDLEGVEVRLERVPLLNGGYDKGGAYWGEGTPLFCAWGDDGIQRLEYYFREFNYQTATAMLKDTGALIVNAEPAAKEDYLNTMTEHYMIAALWSCTMDNGDAFDKDHSIADVDPSSRLRCKKECQQFIALAGDLLKNWSAEQAGHDFWLSRNRHGAGFFNRSEKADGATCKALQNLCRQYGERFCFTHESGDYKVGIE